VASDLHQPERTGGSVMGSIYQCGTIHGLKYGATDRKAGRARAIRERPARRSGRCAKRA